MNYKKYLAVTKNEWLRIVEYRFSVFSYRIGGFLEIFIQIIIWNIIYKSTDLVYGYTYNEMITYILIGYLFYFLTSNYGFETHIAKSIRLGTLSSILCKPISWLSYILSTALGRVYVTLISSLGMQLAIILLFYKSIIPPESVMTIVIIFLLMILGFFIKVSLSIIIGMVAFWTVYVGGIQYSAKMFMSFFSGSFFTLALLPTSLLKIALWMPFAYTFFVPTQIYLGKMTIAEGWRGVMISVLWLLVLCVIIKIVWERGIKKYESVGI